jgi:cytochrome c oxidase subunit 2
MTTGSWRRRARIRARHAVVLAGSALMLAACSDNSTKEQNPLEPKGDVARRQIGLLEFWMIPAGIIGVGVIAATVILAIKFRERPGNENPKQIHGNSVLEVGWTIVPALIMAIMAVPTIALIWDLDAKPAEALEVTVYGKQWWWEYQYTNLDLMDPAIDYQVNTANELHIPSGRPVYFTLKSDNVIHSFWVPSLAGKKDVVPGRDNNVWFEADTNDEGQWFYGQCAEYCGLSHADMRIKVYVHSPEGFLEWVRAQNTGWSAERVAEADALRITGANSWGCTSCHFFGGTDEAADAAIADGTGANVRPGPNLTHLDGRTTFAGAKYDLDPEKLAQWIYDAPDLKPAQCNKPFAESGTRCKGMPSFKKSGMTLDEARAIADFLLRSEQ